MSSVFIQDIRVDTSDLTESLLVEISFFFNVADH